MTYPIKVGDKYFTRDGRSVRIVCTDVKTIHPIIGLIEEGVCEIVARYHANGANRDSSDLDLILPTPKTKRVAPVIYKGACGFWVASAIKEFHNSNLVFFTREDAPIGTIWLEHLAVEVPDDE